MSKEVWCEAYERLSHQLHREPTEDEIVDYIAAEREALYETVAERQSSYYKTFDRKPPESKTL